MVYQKHNIITESERNRILGLYKPKKNKDFIFDFDEPLEYRDLYREDADYQHKFYMVYQNSTGSRKEEIKIDPINFQF